MNERIKQIAWQAGMTDDKFGMFFALLNHNEDGVDLEKFAELIVKECAKAVEDSIWHLPRGYKAVDQAKFVKRHFGVEE